MIALALMLAAAGAAPMTAIDAERAFAADAQKLGQWTAFRKWSTDDAVMFVPQVTNAHAFLKDRKNPPNAIDWWPTASWISCDGNLAINTGGWKRTDGSTGYFNTVWQRQRDGGWKWVLDLGGQTKTPRLRNKPMLQRVPCAKGRLYLASTPDESQLVGSSKDKSLYWMVRRDADGSMRFTVARMAGRRKLIDDIIPAPQ